MPAERRSWLVALGACLALVVIPLSLWWVIQSATARRPLPPPPPEPVMTEPPATPTEDLETDGLRLVTGTVSDAEGAVVAGATIQLETIARIRTTSDDSGHFTLEGVPLEPVTVTARAEGYEEWSLELDEGRAGDREEVTVLLETARGAGGRVVDVAGNPVLRALVTCRDVEEDPTLGESTDEQGRFVMPSRAVGCEAVARHPDHGDSEPTILEAGEDNLLRLREPASLAGYVLDERGSPLPGASVSIERFVAASEGGGAGKRGTKARADDRGEFELGKLQAGTYILTATAEGRPPGRSDEIALADGEQVRGIRIELGRGALLTGRVMDVETGEPIAGARVWLDALTLTHRVTPTTTDADGAYQLDGVPEGPFSVAVSAEGYVRRVVAGVQTRGADAIERDLELTASTDGATVTEYSGIGAMLARPPEGLMIGQVVAGGPSEEAGLQPRDRILRIDGEDTSDLTVSQAVQLLRGPSGTGVSLTIEREGEGQLDVVITRETFTR